MSELHEVAQAGPATTKADCPFCDYTGPSEVLADYGDVFVVEPLNPVAPGHLLAVATDHVQDALAAPSVAAQAVEAALDYANLIGVTTLNLITSVGVAASQTVPHLHVHLIPRAEGDGVQLPWSIR